jgi:ADP-ribose pyrophosphatase
VKTKGRPKKIKTKWLFKGRLFQFATIELRAPSGRKFSHQVVYHPGAAVVLPLLDGERFAMVRQYRTAVEKNVLELPAGTLEHDESPLLCAKREIQEEVGFRAKSWKKLVTYYPAVGISTERMHIFLAQNLTPCPMALEQDEYLTREIVSFRQLKKMVESGTIADGKTLLAFHYYCQYIRKR